MNTFVKTVRDKPGAERRDNDKRHCIGVGRTSRFVEEPGGETQEDNKNRCQKMERMYTFIEEFREHPDGETRKYDTGCCSSAQRTSRFVNNGEESPCLDTPEQDMSNEMQDKWALSRGHPQRDDDENCHLQAAHNSGQGMMHRMSSRSCKRGYTPVPQSPTRSKMRNDSLSGPQVARSSSQSCSNRGSCVMMPEASILPRESK
jgi:hypothetical protein